MNDGKGTQIDNRGKAESEVRRHDKKFPFELQLQLKKVT